MRRTLQLVLIVAGAVALAYFASRTAGHGDSAWRSRANSQGSTRATRDAPAGAVESHTALPGIDAFEAPKPIPFVLTATSIGRNAREGIAVIGTDAGNAQTYAANALLPNGARLLEIYTDRVVIERDSATAVLHLRNETSANRVGEAAEMLTSGKAGVPNPVMAPPLPTLTAVVRSRPLFEEGTFKGMQVDPGPDAPAFAALGLQPGDVITEVAGEPLEHRRSLADVLETRSVIGSAVEVSLQRHGRAEVLMLNLDELATRMSRSMDP